MCWRKAAHCEQCSRSALAVCLEGRQAEGTVLRCPLSRRRCGAPTFSSSALSMLLSFDFQSWSTQRLRREHGSNCTRPTRRGFCRTLQKSMPDTPWRVCVLSRFDLGCARAMDDDARFFTRIRRHLCGSCIWTISMSLRPSEATSRGSDAVLQIMDDCSDARPIAVDVHVARRQMRRR
eukprot:4443629-Pleurochrysis_carterae.AAC.1